MLLYVPTVVNGVPENAVCLCSFRWYGVVQNGGGIETADPEIRSLQKSCCKSPNPDKPIKKTFDIRPLRYSAGLIVSGVRSRRAIDNGTKQQKSPSQATKER
mgnify:CR=1 FL=1